ncbi:glycoside hydrolase family 1 protein [Microbacterium rhizosphaerae]
MSDINRFLWGASTAPMQIEGNNLNSDWWRREAASPGMEPSGDACDSYHRYPEDIALLAESGLDTYRFGIEWSRIEPRPGQVSRAELAHYRRMIDTCLHAGVTPVVTVHHFSNPLWFADEGGWMGSNAVDRFTFFAETVAPILGDVPYLITMNEPNMLAQMMTIEQMMREGTFNAWQSPTVARDGDEEPVLNVSGLPAPTREHSERLIEAHRAARDVLSARTDARVGWSVANQVFEAVEGGEERLRYEREAREDVFLEAARSDDFLGVQAYSAQSVGPQGPIAHQPAEGNTLVGTPFRPDALGLALRHAWDVARVPLLVTENGIATGDDDRRIQYTAEALRGLFAAARDGVELLGYLHWTLLDNWEWGHWGPTFGLIGVDRVTFERSPKPSLEWLGRVARSQGALVDAGLATADQQR